MDRKQQNQENFYYGYKNDRYNFANFSDNTKSTQSTKSVQSNHSNNSNNSNRNTSNNSKNKKSTKNINNNTKKRNVKSTDNNKAKRNIKNNNDTKAKITQDTKKSEPTTPKKQDIKSTRQSKSTQRVKATKPKKAKRVRVHSHRYIKVVRAILSIVCVLFVFGVSIYLSLTVWFKTQKFRVEGNSRYTQSQILDLCKIEMGENIFLSNKKETEANIKQNLPYVSNVDVRFSIPETIVIDVTDAEISYQLYSTKGYLAMSSEGRVLEMLGEKKSDIVTIVCNIDKDIQVGDYVDAQNNVDIINTIKNELTKLNLLDNITIIDIKNLAKIHLIYEDRINIVIGMPEDINYKLRTAITIINDKIDTNNSGTIKGKLDVSLCKETKKSYFNDNDVYQLQSNKATQITQSPYINNSATQGNTNQNVEGTSENIEDVNQDVEDVNQDVEDANQDVEDASQNVEDTNQDVENTSETQP